MIHPQITGLDVMIPAASVFLGMLRNLSKDEDIPGAVFISVPTLLLLWIVYELSLLCFLKTPASQIKTTGIPSCLGIISLCQVWGGQMAEGVLDTYVMIRILTQGEPIASGVSEATLASFPMGSERPRM